MGSACSRSSMSMHASVEVDASCETAWNTKYDIENLPSTTPSNISEAQVLMAGDEQKVGLKWREIRYYAGQKNNVINTVISATSKPHLSSTFSVCYTDDTWETREANMVGTFSVYPVHVNNNLVDVKASPDPPRCRIVVTATFVTEGCMGVYMKLFGRRFLGPATDRMRAELEDYGKEAARRQQLLMANNDKQKTIAIPPSPWSSVVKEEEENQDRTCNSSHF